MSTSDHSLQSQARSRSRVAVVVLLGLAILGGAASYFAKRKSPAAESAGKSAARMHYETGVKLARSDDLTGASNEWQTAIGLDSEYARAHLALVKLAEQKGDFGGAVKQLDALRRADPQAVHITCRQAGLYLRAGRFEKAAAMARESVDSEPDCPQAHTMLGAILAKSGDWAHAVPELETAHRIDLESAPVTMALAVALGHAGKADEAITLLETMPESERGSPHAQYRLGWLLAEYGRNGHKDEKSALEALYRARATDPANAESNAEAGKILLRQGDTKRARAHFENALHSEATNAVAARGMASIFASQHLPEATRARQIAETLEKRETTLRDARRKYLMEPADTANALRLAELEARTGNRLDALDLITGVLKADPNNGTALALLHRLTTSLEKQ